MAAEQGSRGSRYALSAPLQSVDALLTIATQRYAFVGKPCDVSALRRLANSIRAWPIHGTTRRVLKGQR